MSSVSPFKEIPVNREILIWFLISTILGLIPWLIFGAYDSILSATSLKELVIYLSISYFIFAHILGFQFALHFGFERTLSKLRRLWSEVISWTVALAGFLLGMINLNWFGSWLIGIFYPEATFSLSGTILTYAVISFIIVGLIGTFILSYFQMRLNIDESYRILYDQERLKKEMDTAREMQMGLMPDKAPDIEEFSISGICLPATETGGDCFDYIWLDDEKSVFGISVVDVSGKGLKAAMTAVMAGGLIQRESSSFQSPAEILRHTNRPMFRKTEKTTFAATLFAAIDIRKKSLTFANAGQMPPLLLRDGKAGELTSQGIRLPLGIKREIKFQERTLPLQKGDILLFYTDGVNETINSKKELFGTDRVKSLLENLGQVSDADSVVDKVIRETNAFRKEHPQNDDLTIVAVCVK